MNNVIRATAAIMGIMRYPGLHVRQQTTRFVHICAYVSMCEIVRTLLASTRKLALSTYESGLYPIRCIDDWRGKHTDVIEIKVTCPKPNLVYFYQNCRIFKRNHTLEQL